MPRAKRNRGAQPGQRIGITAMAAALGIPRGQLAEAEAKGLVPPRGKDGKWRREECIAAYRASVKPNLAKHDHSVTSADGTVLSYNEERTLETHAKRVKIELQNAQRKGELVERDQVVAHWSSVGAQIRDRLLSLPDRLATQLAAEADALAIRQTLRAEITECLQALSDDITERYKNE